MFTVEAIDLRTFSCTKKAFVLFLCIVCLSFSAHAEIRTDLPYGGLFTPPIEMRWMAAGWAKSLENVTADIAFFGDSITFGGKWEEAFPDQMSINLGVSGDSAFNLAIRMPLIETLMPSKCFMMIGVNDLLYQETIKEILEMYEWLLIELNEQRQTYGLTVYLQSILPVNEDQCVYDVSNQDIKTLNNGIQKLASDYGMIYIDLFPLFTDEEGMLAVQYSYDGLHLSDEGYRIWYDTLLPFVEE